jgi:hypothetical protein
MMKNRLEDLGALRILLDQAFKHELFDLPRWTRDKDAPDVFFESSKDEQEEFIHKLAYAISDLREKIGEMCVIAEGEEE